MNCLSTLLAKQAEIYKGLAQFQIKIDVFLLKII